MIIKRFIVKEEIAEPYILQDEKINQDFMTALNELPSCENPEVYINRHRDLVYDFSKIFKKNKNAIIFDRKLAPAISGSDIQKLSFDNFLTWEIEVNIYGERKRRMFIEVCCMNPNLCPIVDPPEWLVEIDDQEFYVLSGVRKDKE